MKKPSNFKVKPKILISLLTLLCVVCLILSAIVPSFSKPFKFATGIMVVPLQEGVNRIGTWFTDKEELMKSVKKLKSENKKLYKTPTADGRCGVSKIGDFYEKYY